MPLRRRPPTLLFTAVAATVIVLPWAAAPDRPRDHAGKTGDTQLVERPLIGVGGGVTIREVSQPTPFSMVALTGEDLTDTSARVRARRADGTWGPWYDAETLDAADGGGPPSGPRGTEPVFVGATTTVQISVTRPAGAPVTSAPPAKTPAKPGLGYRPATVEHRLAQNISAILIAPPRAPADTGWAPPTAVIAPGQPPNIISRSQWGADESIRCSRTLYGRGIRAAVVHHTAEGNDYEPQDSAAIVRSIYAYHTRTLGWCDIAYNALVDRYGQVFEGRAGGIDRAVEGSHTGGFNHGTWGVAMIGNFDEAPPTPIQLRTVGRLLGWRMGLDHVDPRSTVTLASAGGPYTYFPAGAPATLPAIFSHRDVGATDCPGNIAYPLLGDIREIAARFNDPPRTEDLVASLQGGAIYARWQRMGGMNSVLGAPTSPESATAGSARYATFANGAMYWSDVTGATPVTGALYDAWAAQGYERGVLGLPTSGEIQEPQRITQNFQHGTLNFDRLSGRVTRVVDGITRELAPPAPNFPPVQLERFSPLTG